MIGYINAIKRGFRDQIGFRPTGGTEHEPLFANIPDGCYPMKINGKVDYVEIVNGSIGCCNEKPPAGYKLTDAIRKRLKTKGEHE